jgi:hypothetical protein
MAGGGALQSLATRCERQQEIDGKGAWGLQKLVAKLVDLLMASIETATDGQTWQRRC